MDDLPSISHCVMQDFRTWLEANRTRAVEANLTGAVEANLTREVFPVPKAQFNEVFRAFIDHVVTGPDGRPMRPARSKYFDSRLVGIEKDGTVKYIIIGWNTIYQLRKIYPSDEIKKVYDRFMELEDEIEAESKKLEGGGAPYICEAKGHEVFLMMRVAMEFEDSVSRGILISICFALLMLLLSTGNAVVALLAVTSISAVTVTTLGCMVLYGWELGLIESICAVLVVGFAVDYTVHFGIAYVERRPEDDGKYNLGSSRHDRMTHAFFELGTSVFAGACTTLGSSLFLFGCKVQLFLIFGIFMCTVIFLSFFFAHLFFMPLLALLGPEGSLGDLSRAEFQRLCGQRAKVHDVSMVETSPAQAGKQNNLVPPELK